MSTPNYYADASKADQKKAEAEGSYRPQFGSNGYVNAQPPPPPPPGYPQSQPSMGPTVTSQPSSTTIVVNQQLGFKSQQYACPKCHQNVQTEVKYETGLFTWLSAGCCCVFGLWCGCCCFPFVSDSFKDAEHKCPNCGDNLGERARL